MTELKPLLDLLSGQFGWLPTALAYLAALKLAMTFFENAFARWIADRLNAVAASSDEDDDEYLREIFSAPAWRTGSLLLRFVGLRFPTLKDLERAIKLQREAAIDAGATLPAQRNPSAGEVPSQPKLPTGPTGSILSAFLWLQLVFCLFTAGCVTAYKTTGAIVVTADHATDAWLDYWVWAKAQPGADLAKLNQQDASVQRAYEQYQAAMEVVYRIHQSASQPDLTAALNASTQAAQAVVNLVLQFLPANRAAQLQAKP